jgi:hypothetical protein
MPVHIGIQYNLVSWLYKLESSRIWYQDCTNWNPLESGFRTVQIKIQWNLVSWLYKLKSIRIWYQDCGFQFAQSWYQIPLDFNLYSPDTRFYWIPICTVLIPDSTGFQFAQSWYQIPLDFNTVQIKIQWNLVSWLCKLESSRIWYHDCIHWNPVESGIRTVQIKIQWNLVSGLYKLKSSGIWYHGTVLIPDSTGFQFAQSWYQIPLDFNLYSPDTRFYWIPICNTNWNPVESVSMSA